MKSASIRLCCVLTAIFFAMSLSAEPIEKDVSTNDEKVSTNIKYVPYSGDGSVVDGHIKKRVHMAPGTLSKKMEQINRKRVKYNLKQSTTEPKVKDLASNNAQVNSANTLTYTVSVEQIEDTKKVEFSEEGKERKTLPVSLFQQNSQK